MAKFEIEDCEIIKDSGKAILVESPNLEEPLWIPQSQVHADSEIWKQGETGTLTITEWWAIKEGLLDD
jgi:hypothetical protein